MKPPSFAYQRPGSVAEAASLLARHAGEARLLAGGQSLVPLLNFRLLRPGMLIDINRLAELDFIRAEDGGLRLGALVRHHALETSPLVAATRPVLPAAMAHVAHLAVRNRGTLGGSLAHADPAAELPMLAVLFDAEIRTATAAGARSHAADRFFLSPQTTDLDEDEMITEILLPPLPPHTGWGFAEVAMRHGDFAIAAVAATLSLAEGRVTQARLAAAGVGETPLRFPAVERALVGEELTADVIAAAAAEARSSVAPPSDLRGSADYRRHLVGVLTRRVLTDAWRRSEEAGA